MAAVGNNRRFKNILGSVSQYCPKHGYHELGPCEEKGCIEPQQDIVLYDAAPSMFIQDELHLVRESLMDTAKVEQYLSMVAPVKFSNDFSWGNEIAITINNQIGPIPTYKLVLITRELSKEINKLYTDTFLLNRTTGVTDQIKQYGYH